MGWTLGMVALLSALGCGPGIQAGPSAGERVAAGSVTGPRAPKEAARSPVGVVRFARSPAGPFRMSPVLPEATAAVYCSFDVAGLAPGTRVSVVWRRAGRELARTGHEATRHTRNLASELVSDEPLGSGSYEVEVLVDGRTEATTSFRIAGSDRPEPAASAPGRPRVVALSLSASDCVPEGPARPATPVRFALGVGTIRLCLEFEDVPEGQTMEVRWYRSAVPRAPLAVTTHRPEGGGELTASFTDTGLLRPGAHHVAVHLEGRELARARFLIER